MTVSTYEQLREEIVRSAVKSSSPSKKNVLLSNLKTLFKEQINSRRKFEQITNFRELLDVLETRDIISPNKVEALEKIVERLGNGDELSRRIAEYKASHVPTTYVNYYALKRSQPSAPTPPAAPYAAYNQLANISQRKRQLIIQKITEEIGTFWRKLGRKLQIRECVIDRIDAENKTVAEKATEIIKLFESRADPSRWFFVLCDALEKASRSDISKSLQDIMSMPV